MKRKLSIILGIIACLSLLFSFTASADDISIYIDNELTLLTDATGARVYPFIQNGTTYVPLRGVSEALDCDVIWDGNNQTILIYKEMPSDNSMFRNNSDEIKVYVDNKLVELKDANGTKVQPFIKEGTTYIPLRGISQALGGWVRWDGPSQTASVYMNVIPPDGVTLSENKPYKANLVNTYYELDGSHVDIDGISYTNALIDYSGYLDSYALFNLDGKYDRMSMVIGATDHFDEEKEVVFIVDGKIADTYTIKPNSSARELTVDLNKGLQLKIQFSDYGGVSMGNIIFWGK